MAAGCAYWTSPNSLTNQPRTDRPSTPPDNSSKRTRPPMTTTPTSYVASPILFDFNALAPRPPKPSPISIRQRSMILGLVLPCAGLQTGPIRSEGCLRWSEDYLERPLENQVSLLWSFVRPSSGISAVGQEHVRRKPACARRTSSSNRHSSSTGRNTKPR
jgi:hypothetical protein